MGNTILTPSVIAKEALMVLRNNAVMANLVHRDYSNEFVAVGDTITVRKPATFTANEYNGSSITVQDITESGVPVKMDKLIDVSFAVTSKEMSLDIADFSSQLLVPAMQAFADKIDSYLIGLNADITNRVNHASGNIAPADVVAARKYLTESAAPLADRRLVIGADAEADLLNNSTFVEADKIGDNGTALREASLGRKYGMDIYVDQNVSSVSNIVYTATEDASKQAGKTYYTKGADGTYTEFSGNSFVEGTTYYEKSTVTYTPSIAFHKNAFALVTRPLALPNGAAKASIENYDGFALRVVYGYDMDKKCDTVSIDMLCGVKTLDKDLAAIIDDKR